jgi:hypothetical protein
MDVPAPPRTILEKFRTTATDPLLPHYGFYLPPFELVFPGSEEECFADLLSLSEAEHPMFVVGVMRDNIPELVPLWGAAQHLDPPHARTAVHGVQTCFCRDVVLGNLPAFTRFECGWLVTKSLELLHEDVFEVKIATSPVGASSVPELIDDQHEDCYVAQAAILPSCLVPDLLRSAPHPLAAWRLLRARATELGLTGQCAGLWRLLRALSSPEHREESCVTLGLLNGDAHFVGTRRGVLEATLPALSSAPTSSAPLLVAGPSGTSTLAAAIAAATRPAILKVTMVEEKWPHSYRRLLLLAKVPNVDALHLFWYNYAGQKKAQRLGLRSIGSLGYGGQPGPGIPHHCGQDDRRARFFGSGWASEDSLNEGLMIWQFPALAPADTDSENERLRSWEGLLTGNTAMSLADVKKILLVGKVGAPKSWLHACEQLEHWTAVMVLLLGAGHDAVTWLLSLA